MSELGTFIKLFQEDGGLVAIAAEHESLMAAAYGEWVEKGVDRMLALDTLSGQPFYTRASHISDFMVSTPDGRATEVALSRAEDRELYDNRLAAGYSFTEIEALGDG